MSGQTPTPSTLPGHPAEQKGRTETGKTVTADAQPTGRSSFGHNNFEHASATRGEAPARLTHVRADGSAHMVDVSAKAVTARSASAAGIVLLSAEAVRALREGAITKGDALAVARIAGIQAAKRTPDLVPLAHPVAVHAVEVDLQVADHGVDIAATVRTADRTGIEMEALTCVTVAALTVIDMTKAVDKHGRITDVRVTAKSGGRSGDWKEATDD